MANGRIKGITIELNGDTTGLTDALKNVNKESNKVTSELREVERALKFDPGNTELIAQKQQLLAEQIQNTSQKLDVLKEAQSQVEAQFQRGDIGAEQYRAFQRELATTEAQLQQYNAQMASTANEQDRLARTTGELSAFFQATGTDVNQFADLLGTRLTNAIRDGSATTDQMNRALRLMGQHALGAGVDIDQMREALRRAAEGADLSGVRQDLARITQEANQAEEAVNGFGQELSGVVAGLVAGGGIAGTIQQALDVSSLNTQIDISLNLNEDDQKAVRQSIMEVTAAIGDEEAAYEGVRRQIALNKDASMESNQEIIKGAAMISNAYKEIDFKELIQESFEIGKELKVSQKEALALTNQLLSVGFPTEQLDIIAEYGGQLQRAGFDAKQIQAIMAAGVETGTWNIDNLLDGLKEGRIRAAEMGSGLSTSMIDALQIIGASEEQFRLWGVAIAEGGEKGNKAFQDMTQYLMNVEDDVARNVLGVELFGTMWEDQGENIAATILNMNNHLQSADDMQKKLNDDIAKINADPAYALSTAMGSLKESLAPLLSSIAQLVAKIAEWVTNNAALASAIVAIVAVIGILVGAFAALMPAVGGLVTAWPALAAAIGAISAPITLVVAAIAGLGVALVAAYQNSETFRENVNNVFQAIKDVAVTVFETVASFIGEKIAQIKQFWDQNGTQILQAVENVFNGIKAVIEFVMPAVKFVIETVWNAIKQVIDGALNVIMGAIKVFTGLFTGDFSKMWEGVKQIFKGAIDLVVGWMTLSFFGGIKTIVTNLAKTGVSLLKGMWDDIAKFFTSMGSKVSSTVSNFSTSVLNFFKNLATNTGSTISNMVSSVINFVKNLATNFVNIISTMKTNVLNKMTEIKDGLINKIKSLPEQFTGIGKDIINGLIKGISAMTANAIESITGVVDGVVNTAKKLLGIHSPSREFMQIGLWTGEGLVIGLDNSSDKVNKAMENIGNGILGVSKAYQKEYTNLIDEFNRKNEDKNDKTLEKIYKIQNNAAKKKRALTQKELQDIALLEATYRDNKLKADQDFNKKYQALVEKSEKDYLEVIKSYIADKKSLEELSLIDEAKIWEQSIDMFVEGTAERIKAQQEHKKAVEAVNKEVTAINTDFSNQINKINDDLVKQEENLTKAYTDAVDKRAQSLVSFKNLFDEFKAEIDVTGGELLTNLKSQVDGFKEWQAEVEKLSARAIDEGLLAELREMGPEALGELRALNSLSDKELTKYSSLYQEKMKLAREQAANEMQSLKTDTEAKIKKLRENANGELSQLQMEWINQLKSLTKSSQDELSSLDRVGKDAIEGLMNGMWSKKGSLEAKVREIAQSIIDTTESVLDIHSPSREMQELGMYVGEGLAIGIEKSETMVLRASQKVVKRVASTFEDLPDYINDIEKKYFKNSQSILEKFYELYSTGDAYGVGAFKFLKTAMEMEHLSYYERESLMKEYENQKYLSGFRLVQMERDYNKKVIEIEEERTRKQSELLAQYEAEVTKRTEEIYKQFGLLDKVELKGLSGDEMINSLDSQINAMETYTASIEKLVARGIGGKLLEEISALGPKAAGQVASFADMTEEELNKYVELWNRKNELAKETAISQLTSMKEDIDKQMIEINEDAEKQLAKYKDEYEFMFNELNGVVSNEMDVLQNNLTSDGQNAMQGLIVGMESMRSNVIATAQSIANAVSSTIQSALDIHSPSRIMRGFGENVGQGLVNGMDDMINKVAHSSQRLAEAVSNAHVSLASSAKKSSRNSSNLSSTSNTTVDNRKSINQTYQIYTVESPEKVIRREWRKMAFRF